MSNLIHTVKLAPDWQLVNALAQLDKFGGSWGAIEKREGQSLKQLKSIATVRSVGASTRIEGSKMTDDEVEALIRTLEISRLDERDAQEVAGYYEALDAISESFRDIDVSENNIKMLHNILMKHSEKIHGIGVTTSSIAMLSRQGKQMERSMLFFGQQIRGMLRTTQWRN